MFTKYLLVFILFTISTFSFVDRFDLIPIYKLYIVMSDSMDPTIHKGSIIVIKKTRHLNVGDIVSFQYPLNISKSITHRIVDYRNDDGFYFITKGDANRSVDPWQLRNDQIIGKHIVSIPLVGYLVSAIKSPVGLFILILLPLSIIIVLESLQVYARFRYYKARLINNKSRWKIPSAFV